MCSSYTNLNHGVVCTAPCRGMTGTDSAPPYVFNSVGPAVGTGETNYN
jgi:hypothetical protein